MDNLTHTLFGATLARTPLARAGRGTTAALLIASNAPDVDLVSAGGGTISYMHWHRGPTHGLLGVLGLGTLTALVVWSAYRALDRRTPARDRPPLASFGMLLAISMIAVAFHVLMDLATSYGTRLLSPFDWHWYAFDWLPIVDIYLLVALALGLIFGSLSGAAVRARGGHGRARRADPPDARRRMAVVILVLMGINYGVRATAHHQALAMAPALFGSTLPAACDPQTPISQDELAEWPTPRDSGREPRRAGAAADDRRPCLVEIAAVPTFLSPFRWRLIARLSNAYELHEVDLLGTGGQSVADSMWSFTLRYPDQWTAATRYAAQGWMARIFLGFCRFPAARTFTDRAGGTIVRWTDVRFAGGITSLQQRSGRPDPFNLTVRLDPAGQIIAQRTGR